MSLEKRNAQAARIAERARRRLPLDPAFPDRVLGLAVRRVADTWNVRDLHGERTYFRLELSDLANAVLLRLEDRYHTCYVVQAR